jgi:hypothetical protein
MKKPAVEVIAAAEIAAVMESATAAEGSRNLEPLLASLSTALRYAPLHTEEIALVTRAWRSREKRSEKRFCFGRSVEVTVHKIKMLRRTISTQTGPPWDSSARHAQMVADPQADSV